MDTQLLLKLLNNNLIIPGHPDAVRARINILIMSADCYIWDTSEKLSIY